MLLRSWQFILNALKVVVSVSMLDSANISLIQVDIVDADDDEGSFF